MTDFQIIDCKGRKFIVQPMTAVGGFNLFDNMGYRHEICRKLPTNIWIKMPYKEVRVTPFEYDVEEIGKLIEDYYRN